MSYAGRRPRGAHNGHHKAISPRLRRAIAICAETGLLERRGIQMELARLHGTTRQLVHQLIQEHKREQHG